MTILRPHGRYAALALVALLTLLWTLSRYRGGSSEPPAITVVAPIATPVTAPAKAKKTVLRKPAHRIVAQLEDPDERAKVRGSRLRDKGEALGGRAPGRVDDSTAPAR